MTEGVSSHVSMFLSGDVMTGRGIDQVLPHPCDPRLHERYMESAIGYVGLAERVNGPIPRGVDFSYIWGDGLEDLARWAPDFRIINLETSITTSGDYVPKGINYRMCPANIPCLTVAEIDCCVLANNHVLDSGYSGLRETLATVRQAGISLAGAGDDAAQAEAPAILERPGRARVLVFAIGAESSGVPEDWAATEDEPGVAFLPGFSPAEVGRLAGRVYADKRPGDIAILSVHWGGNWGYAVPFEHQWFARAAVDYAGIDIVHGHSSHHPMPMEVYKGRPILYGCGDLLNDYEGIGGHEEFRSHLVLTYVLTVEAATGTLLRLEMPPFEIKRFRLQRVRREDAEWLCNRLNREMRRLNTQVMLRPDGVLELEWR